MRRSVFKTAKVLEHWRSAVSDDFAVTRALQSLKLPIVFVPQCLTASYESCSLSQLFEFTTRQIKITRVYAPHLWKSVLLGSVIFALTFWGGLLLIAVRAALGLSFTTPAVLLLIIFTMGAMKSDLRWQAVSQFINKERSGPISLRFAHTTLWPLASSVYLYNAITAAVSRRITWRGITYDLKSPNETVVVSRSVTTPTVSR